MSDDINKPPETETPDRKQMVIEALNGNHLGFFTTHKDDLETAKQIWEIKSFNLVELNVSPDSKHTDLLMQMAKKLLGQDKNIDDLMETIEVKTIKDFALLINLENNLASISPAMLLFADYVRNFMQNSNMYYIAYANNLDMIPEELKSGGKLLL